MLKLLPFVLLAVVTREAAAQTGALGAPARLSYVASGRERWLYPGQRATSAPWRVIEEEVAVLDSIRRTLPRGDGSQSDALRSISRQGRTMVVTTIWRNRAGALDSATTLVDTSAMRGLSLARSPRDAARVDDGIFSPMGDMVELFAMHLGAPSTSRQATPVRLSARTNMNDISVTGALISRVVGDTVVNGRRLQIVRDSGGIQLTSRRTVYVRTLFGEERSERRARGIVQLRRVVDTARGLTLRAVESVSLAGEETRHLADSTVRATPVRFDRTRTIEMLDSASARAFREAQNRRLGFGVGMIRRPISDAPVPNVRLPHVVDSLVRAHERARTAEARDSIEAVPNLLYGRGVRERLAKTYAATGDTARALSMLTLDIRDQLTPWVYRLVRPLLNDPRLALRYGLETNELYEAFEYAFRYYPTVAMPNVDSAWCSPAACQLVGDEWERATEPRLKLIGLMARFSVDPATWGDTLDRLARDGARALMPLSERGRGIRFVRADEVPLEMPSASADWREWLVWLRGGSVATLARRDSIDAARGQRLSANAFAPPLGIRDVGQEAVILKLVARRRGMSYLDSLAKRFAAASNDSARYVYGSVLGGFGAPARSPEALRLALASTSVLDQAIAKQELTRLRFETADSTTARAIESTLLGRLIDGSPLWARLTPTAAGVQEPISTFRTADSAHIVADSLTAASLAQLARARVPVHPSTWSLPAAASGRVFRIGAVHRVGAFARITVSDTRLVRLADGRGGGNAHGSTLILVLIDGEWKLLEGSWWVT